MVCRIRIRGRSYGKIDDEWRMPMGSVRASSTAVSAAQRSLTITPGRTPPVRKLNCNIPEKMYEELASSAREHNRSMTEIIRIGINLAQAALDAKRDGNHLVLHSAEGKPIKEFVVAG